MRLALLALPFALACTPAVETGVGGIPIDPTGGSGPADDAASYIPGSYLVRFAPGLDSLDQVSAHPELSAALADLGATGMTPIAAGSEADFLRHTFGFASDRPVAEVLETLHLSEDVVIAEPLVRMEAFAAPNDPLFAQQWHMRDVGVPEVWEASTGEGAVVAVLDTGVAPGLDGFAHLLDGIDIVGGHEGPIDGHGHGTHVAGTIAQRTDNGYGVAGVAPQASILPVRVLGDSGSGTSAGVAEGIVWAADHGAHIINMSLGSWSSARVIEDACRYAADKGVLIVAAAGNDGFSDSVSYPAAYETVIAVGALDARRERAFYSNRGDAVELAAPGGDTGVDLDGDGYVDGVLQETRWGGVEGFHYFMGTSMATPHVAGAAALVHAAGVTDAEDIRAVLGATAVDLGTPGRDGSFGFGLVDPIAAIGGIPDEPDEPVETPCAADLCVDDLAAGDLVITEVMANPSACGDHLGEWIEVANRTAGTVDLDGLRIVDEAPTEGAVDGSVVLEPGQHAVLGRGDATTWCGAFTPDAYYGAQPSLNNDGDQLTLQGAVAIGQSLRWDDATAGTSWERDPASSAWHLATTPIADTAERGSPGVGAGDGADAPDAGDPLTLIDLSPGDLVITEVMANPARGVDASHEWIEVLNTTPSTVDLYDLWIVDDDGLGLGVIAGSVLLAPGEVAVLARGDGTGWDYGFTPDAWYGEMPALGNGGDLVELWGYESLDAVELGRSQATSGVSWELRGGEWGHATEPIGTDGDLGTPGRLD